MFSILSRVSVSNTRTQNTERDGCDSVDFIFIQLFETSLDWAEWVSEATLDLAKSLMFERILLLLCPALRWPPSDYSRLRCIFLDGVVEMYVRNFCFIIAAYVQDVWAPWMVGYRNQLVKSWNDTGFETKIWREDNLTDWVAHTTQRVTPVVL